MFAADQERWSAKSNARSGSIVRFIWHHQAGTNDDGTLAMMTTAGLKDVSATWTVDNKAPVGGGLRDYARITAVVPEERRPWTTASALDDGALTVECANSSGPPDYGIAEASLRACARLAAYAKAAHGVPLQRATAANGWRGHMGHNEAPDTYATACPLHLDIDRILELAGGGSISPDPIQPTTPPRLDDDMPTLLLKPGERATLPVPYPRAALFVACDNPDQAKSARYPDLVIEGADLRVAIQTAEGTWAAAGSPFPAGAGLATRIGLGSTATDLPNGARAVSVINRGELPVSVVVGQR